MRAAPTVPEGRTLHAKNLTLTHEERFLQLMALQRLAAELQRAGREAAGL
jgi:hypothetical protein